ncbi:MAG: hypothetical protein LBN93_06630 [Candidatus Symbiothrix sp.]|jgi:hypothetical protein|nr:hypothetical protein [Candidatus Symbiothrix sp.]
MKKIMILAAIAVCASVMLTGCKSKKVSSEVGATEIVLPLSGKDYTSNKDFFRTTQLGKSPDLSTAKKIALQNAKTELAANIQSTIKAVTDNYTNQISVADKQEFENKFEELQRAVVNQELNDVHVIGEKVFKEKDGKYTYYIAIEMSKEIIERKTSDRISNDAKLKLDFDKFQYQKIFDEEMKKFENQ